MFSKILKIFSVLILIFLVVVASLLFKYRYTQNKNYKYIEQCKTNAKNLNDSEKNICYEKVYELITPKLLTYKVRYKNKNVGFKVFPPGYVMPLEILKDTDVMLGYGVGEDMDAEEMYSSLFKKPSYGYDCGVDYVPKEPLAHFERSCIVTDKYILNDELHNQYHQISSGKTHKFKQKLNELDLNDKKLVVKADIGEALLYALPDILDKNRNIQVITLVFLMPRMESALKTLEFLGIIENGYVLISRAEHPDRRSTSHIYHCKYIKEPVSDVIVLTFVNKQIVDKIYLPWNQTSFDIYATRHKSYSGTFDKFKPTTISKIVVLNQKIKNIKERILNK